MLGLDTGARPRASRWSRRPSSRAQLARSAASHGAELPAAVDELLARGGTVRFAISARSRSASARAHSPDCGSGSAMPRESRWRSDAPRWHPEFRRAGVLRRSSGIVTPAGRLICPILDARKGEVYAALYRVVADGLEKLSEDLVIALRTPGSRITGRTLCSSATQRAEETAAGPCERGRHGRRFCDDRDAQTCAASASRRWARRGLSRGETDRRLRPWSRYTSRSPEATFKPYRTSSSRRHGGRMERREEELIQQHRDPRRGAAGALRRSTRSSNTNWKPSATNIHLTTEEELEKKRIQKLKLASKDRLMAILDRHQHDEAR